MMRYSYTYRKACCCLILLLFMQGIIKKSFAQSAYDVKMPVVTPPSPEAASIGRYGQMPIGLFTGSASAQVPVYELTIGGYKLPISLSYSSNGVKVDQLASRVGIDWNLNCGGAITRTVYGRPDEIGPRIYPPDEESFEQNQALLNYLVNATNNSDTQPDQFFFNFNGNSGKFFLNRQNQVVCVSKNNFKITPTSTALDGFVITTGDGIKYHFGGAGAIDKSRNDIQGSGCSRSYDQFTTTSWYLTKIELVSGYTISFSYKPVSYSYLSSVSQTVIKSLPATDPVHVDCPTFPTKTCYSLLYVDGVYLSDISASDGSTVSLSYSARPDILSDVKLDSIRIYNNQGRMIRKTELEYYVSTTTSVETPKNQQVRHRIFLKSVREFSGDHSSSLTYGFEYEDINGLPPRLSFSQDYFGFFNGANNGDKFVPDYKDGTVEYNGADRNPNYDKNRKGILKKIVYPTGGFDSLVYESNTTYQCSPEPPKNYEHSAYSTPNDRYDTTYFSIAQIGVGDRTTANLSIFCSTDPDNPGIPHHNVAWGKLLDVASSNTVISGSAREGQPYEGLATLYVNRTYALVVESRGSAFGGIYINYSASSGNIICRNVLQPGIRVKRTLSFDSNNKLILSKKYLYAAIADTTKSSGTMTNNPVFHAPFITKIRKGSGDGGSVIDCYGVECRSVMLFSNSQLPLYMNSNANTCYSHVLEFNSDGVLNGCTEYHYNVREDERGNPIIGNDILGAPLKNDGWMNGNLLRRRDYLFKDNKFNLVKEQRNVYGIVDGERIKAYLVNKKFDAFCDITPPQSYSFEPYDFFSYDIKSGWIHVDTVINVVYGQNMNDSIKVVQAYRYDNSTYLNKTRETSIGSDGDVNETYYTYPYNYTSTAAYAQMVARNMVDPVIEETYRKNNVEIGRKRTNYKDWFADGRLLAPEMVDIKVGAAPYDPRIRYHSYDNLGNPLSVSKENDVQEVFFWGYRGQYPVAKITGTDYNTAKQYINQSILDNPASDQQLRTELNKLRANLTGALVTTYTYAPLIGVTSETDPSGKTIYYEYDSFGRLKLIKDQDGRILKQYDYQYQRPVTQ